MKKELKKYIWMSIGLVSFGLGTVGIILPILPTFPFYLLSLFCFTRSSKKVQEWFIGTKLYKENVDKILKKEPISIRSKLILIITFTMTMGLGFYFMKSMMIGRIILALVWFCHMVYFIFAIKTIKKSTDKSDK